MERAILALLKSLPHWGRGTAIRRWMRVGEQLPLLKYQSHRSAPLPSSDLASLGHLPPGEGMRCGDQSKKICRMFSGMERNIISTAVSAGVMLSCRSHSRVMPTEPQQTDAIRMHTKQNRRPFGRLFQLVKIASQSSRLGCRESNPIDFPATCAAENLPEAQPMLRPRTDQPGQSPVR